MIREKEEEEEEGSRRSKRSRRSRRSGIKTESAARLTGTEKGVDMGNRMTRILNGGRGYEGEDMMLYWVSGSPACFRVMLALEEKKLSRYKQKHLSFTDNEHKTDDILRLNPRGQVRCHFPSHSRNPHMHIILIKTIQLHLHSHGETYGETSRVSVESSCFVNPAWWGRGRVIREVVVGPDKDTSFSQLRWKGNIGDVAVVK